MSETKEQKEKKEEQENINDVLEMAEMADDETLEIAEEESKSKSFSTPEEKKEAEESKMLSLDELPTEIYKKMVYSKKLKNISDQAGIIVRSYFEKTRTPFEFGLIVIKCMEALESYNIPAKHKKNVAITCVVNLIMENKALSKKQKLTLIQTIPGSIEAIIELSRERYLNKKIKGLTSDVTASIAHRVLKCTNLFVKKKKYSGEQIVENIFLIATKVMFFVGGFSNLKGIEKKTIVIEVLKKIMNNFVDKKRKSGLDNNFILNVVDTLPGFIDNMVNVSRGRFDINTVATAGCLALLFCCGQGKEPATMGEAGSFKEKNETLKL